MNAEVLEWKKVNFFNIVGLPFVKLPNISEIACHCFNLTKSDAGGNKNTLVFCDKNGHIHVYFPNWECISFKSQHRVHHIRQCALTSNNLLATATQDTTFVVHIDIYDLKKLTKKQGAPIIASGTFNTTSTTACINASCIIDDKILVLALGFENGDILLHNGKINRFLLTNTRRHSISGHAINGIHFDIRPQSSDKNALNMFVTCLDGVYCFILKEKGAIVPKFMLDNNERAYNHCCTLRKASNAELDDSMLVVGREDAIYCYTREGRGPCYAIKGKKKSLDWVGHYLIVLVQSPRSFYSDKSKLTLIVVDTEIKIIVFYKQIQDLCYTISENDLCYIITNCRDSSCTNIFKLQQCNTNTKIRLLIEQNMYNIALQLLSREGLVSSYDTAYVRFQYGNYLVLKGDISRAVIEYTKTIGFIKPYDVISKLLHSRYTDYLKEYLYEFLKANNATNKHKQLFKLLDQKNWKAKNNFQPVNTTDNLYLNTLSNIPSRNLNSTNVGTQAKNFEGDEILHFHLEFGPESLMINPETYLKNFRSVIIGKTTKNILCFFPILSEHNEFCANLLAEIIGSYPSCDDELYDYLLILYLGLWRDRKKTTGFILDFLKNDRLRLEKVLIICRLYIFLNGIKQVHTNLNDADIVNNGGSNKCVHSLLKSYPDLTYVFELRTSSLLIMLNSGFRNNSIHALQFKPFIREKIVQNILDSRNELQIIENLNKKIKKAGSMLSLYANNPIEFRNSVCDICRQSLNMQSVYFLCQHSFHKECLIYNMSRRGEEAICVSCSGEINYSADKNIHSESTDSITVISKVISMGIVEIATKNGFSRNFMHMKGPDSNVWRGKFNATKSKTLRNPFDSNINISEGIS
ncbi:vacuolar protein sorting-associated protein 11 homolog [Drosophila obscura]|uniref:vacuolar protein sorting-associated protein 11 homolog n=1 Tax=Drosophila obscura TaxID=7282 RepID=UPI001BB25598|nr:vacuolar protein sorting-associated protein 11 homolog [Drosophila obscura]